MGHAVDLPDPTGTAELLDPTLKRPAKSQADTYCPHP